MHTARAALVSVTNLDDGHHDLWCRSTSCIALLQPAKPRVASARQRQAPRRCGSCVLQQPAACERLSWHFERSSIILHDHKHGHVTAAAPDTRPPHARRRGLRAAACKCLRCRRLCLEKHHCAPVRRLVPQPGALEASEERTSPARARPHVAIRVSECTRPHASPPAAKLATALHT